QTLHRLPTLLKQANDSSQLAMDISFPEIEKFDRLPEPSVDGPTAFVSIMEGCSKYCSFCVVPYTRGEEVSRPVASVMKEIEHLVILGVRVVNLLVESLFFYSGLEGSGCEGDFAELLMLVNNVTGFVRIRYITSHPIESFVAIIEVN